MTKNSTTWNNLNGTWKHGKTTIIRVPILLSKKILEYARAVDESTTVPDAHDIPKLDGDVFFQQQVILAAVEKYIEWKRENYHPNQNSKNLDVSTRSWDELRKFQTIVSQKPENLFGNTAGRFSDIAGSTTAEH